MILESYEGLRLTARAQTTGVSLCARRRRRRVSVPLLCQRRRICSRPHADAVMIRTQTELGKGLEGSLTCSNICSSFLYVCREDLPNPTLFRNYSRPK